MSHKDARRKGFSIFRTAAEEAQMKDLHAAQEAAEGGQMSCKSGRIVVTSGTALPFTAIMTRGDGTTFELAFQTMGAAEAFVRRNTPSPSVRSTTYDHDVG